MSLRGIYINMVLATISIVVASCAGRSEESKPEQTVAPLVAFCTNIDYVDTFAIRNERMMRDNIATIVKMLPVSDSVSVVTGLRMLFNGMRHDETAIVLAAGYFDKYLNNPSSPARNEELYIKVLSILLEMDSLSELVRTTATERLHIASLNRKGTIAADIVFEKPDGSLRTLHGVEAEMTLLVFYDPECSHCGEILKGIAKNKVVNSEIAAGRLKVVAIYTEGKRDIWRNGLGKMPRNWIIGFDKSGIVENEIYDVPAMPILYLLDTDKRVLEKDLDSRRLPSLLQ